MMCVNIRQEKQMKRIVSLIMIISMLFCSCGREEDRKTVSNSGSGAVGNTVTESAVSGGAATGSAVSGGTAEEEEKEYTENKYLNDYFPYVHNQKVSLAGRILDWYDFEGMATLQFQNVMTGSKGELWKVTIVELDDAKRSKEELEDVRSLFGDLFYYFVTPSEIYWIVREELSAKQKKKICNDAKLPEDTHIVCRNKKMVVDKEGWHYRIFIEKKATVEFSAWFKQEQESSYLRNITLKKGRGIVKFCSSRTVAGAESIELWDDSMYYSKGYSVIEER